MRPILAALAALAFACSAREGASPPVDAGGHAAPAVDAGGQPVVDSGTGGSGTAPPPTWTWVDATGAVAIHGELLILQDAQGYHWYYPNPETGRAQTSVGSLWFASTDCTGTAYVAASEPRWPFKVVGETQWRVRPDTLLSAPFQSGSFRNEAGCTTAAQNQNLIPLVSTVVPSPQPADPPVFTPPLHRELR